MNYVVDASVAVKWYVPENHSDDAERLLDPANELHAPELIAPEFGNIIWKKIRRGELTEKRGREIIEAFLSVPMLKYPTTPLLEVAFAGATQTGQTVYDWTYLALAISLNCRMVTADEKFYRAIQPGAMATHILWVEDIP
jgi:predicted nucleic acid-binding protein